MIQNIVETIRKAFETRDFGPFVDQFAADGVYETPFANSKIEGIAAIRKHFDQMTESAINKSIKIEKVTVNSILAADGTTVFVAFQISGSGFDFSSSVAVLYTENDKIIRYEDYPNVAGIRKAAGI